MTILNTEQRFIREISRSEQGNVTQAALAHQFQPVGS